MTHVADATRAAAATAAAPTAAALAALPTGEQVHAAHQPGTWWREDVIYQIYPRSWADSDGDGIGDLPAITERLPYLRDLGVDAVWLSPFYSSPMNDAGYDVRDYLDVDRLFGTLEDADAMIARAHELGLRVIVDLVPNHTSSEHAWFQAALAAGPGSPERERYMFREGRGESGELPPNDWRSVFGGPAWSRVEDGQWYLHLFDVTQPDLNWRSPEVGAMFEQVLRFWLDRGVDGFRVDVAHGLFKQADLPDHDDRAVMAGTGETGSSAVAEDTVADLDDLDDIDDIDDVESEGHHNRGPMWDQPEVHEVYRRWREIVDEYRPQGEGAGESTRILVAEAWVSPPSRLARYVRPDEMHQAFNFDFLECPFTAADLRRVITASLRQNDAVGAPTTWVLSNHDVVRHASRLGYPVGTPRPSGIGADDPQPDAEVGLRRARAATALMLALPGSAYLYQGEELGLPEHTTMPDEHRQDPTFERTGHAELGRDGCRVPMPWEAQAPSCGFGPTEATWLPQPEVYREYAVDRQSGVEGSTLELYRTLLRLRREHALGAGDLAWVEGLPSEVLGLRNGDLHVLLNTGQAACALPASAQVLAASGPLAEESGQRVVPEDTTVWLTL